LIAITLLSTGLLAATFPATAHTPAWNVPTYAYVTASPNIVGLGEYTVFVMWLDKYPATAGGLGGDRWRGFTLDITKPDATTQQLGPFTSSQIGSIWTVFTPDQVGNYTIVFSWPGQTLTNGTGVPRASTYEGDYFMPSTSAPITLQVTQNPVNQWQEPAPTTDYWTRPISSANRGWSNLLSNWLKGSWLVDNFQTAGQGPNSAHILWAKPIIAGGIPDAQWPGNSYDTDDYESPWTSPIIMNGVIYYNTGIYPKYGYYAVDLQTGEQLWYRNGTENMPEIPIIMQQYSGLGGAGVHSGETYPSLSFGQLYHYYSLNGQGVLTYLWITYGNSWYMLDANTGNWILTLTNVPGGTAVVDQDGSLLRYSYNSRTGNILCWNSSQSIPPASPTGTGQQQWKPMTGATINAVNDTTWTEWGPRGGTSPILEEDIQPRSGYTMNVTGPIGLPGLSSVLLDENRVPQMMLFSNFNNNPSFGSSELTFQAAAVQIDYNAAPYSPLPNATFTQNNNLGYGVTLLWNKTITKPQTGNITFSLGSRSFVDGVFTIESKETMQRWGYDLNTGDLIWGPTQPEAAFNMYGMTGNVAYGKIFSTGYAGILYCYDIKNGSLLWTYSAPGIGYESPYGDYPLSIGAIADGKIYLYSTEHSPTIPLWRGSYLRCIDVNTGTELWKLLDFNMGLGLADGYIVTGNKYDNRMYVVGKGPSATTVTAPDIAVSLGTGVVIRVTVTDQSPGAKGTPAISDADQQAWMEYLYEQQAKPTDAQGVPVKLTAVDPNGNIQDIGTVTSDINGVFHKMWNPPIEGEYKIIATFEGSASYGSSIAETSIGVGPAVSAAIASPSLSSSPTQTTQTTQPTLIPEQTQAASPTPAVQPPGNATPTMTYLAIGAVVIIIIAAAAAIILRRRK
jgi:hypothetical protein